MYTITVQLPDTKAVSTELRNGRCVIGRLASRSDLVVNDPWVSSAHLLITEKDGELTVEDLGSSNGTFMEGEKLPPHEPRPLTPDQSVNIGSSLLTISEQNSWEMTRVSAPVYKPRYVGVLYTDIVNSTVMTAKLGPERGTELLEWHNQMFRERFKRYGGRESKFTGDGFEAVFTSVTDALGCAAACQRALARRNQQDPRGFKLEVRMGVNGGEAPASGKRVFGMPLILAARVMALANAAQVLVPAHVAGITAGSLLPFTPIGPRQLKGLEDPVELMEFLWQQDPSVQTPEELRADAAVAPPRRGTAPLR
jgi:class 3 adenylate cyclase